MSVIVTLLAVELLAMTMTRNSTCSPGRAEIDSVKMVWPCVALRTVFSMPKIGGGGGGGGGGATPRFTTTCAVSDTGLTSTAAAVARLVQVDVPIGKLDSEAATAISRTLLLLPDAIFPKLKDKAVGPEVTPVSSTTKAKLKLFGRTSFKPTPLAVTDPTEDTTTLNSTCSPGAAATESINLIWPWEMFLTVF